MAKAIRNAYYAIMCPILDLIGVPSKLRIFLLYPNTTAKYNTGLTMMILGWFIAIGSLGTFLCEITGVESFGLSGTTLGILAILACFMGFIILIGYSLYEEAEPHQKKLKARSRVKTL